MNSKLRPYRISEFLKDDDVVSLFKESERLGSVYIQHLRDDLSFLNTDIDEIFSERMKILELSINSLLSKKSNSTLYKSFLDGQLKKFPTLEYRLSEIINLQKINNAPAIWLEVLTVIYSDDHPQVSLLFVHHCLEESEISELPGVQSISEAYAFHALSILYLAYGYFIKNGFNRSDFIDGLVINAIYCLGASRADQIRETSFKDLRSKGGKAKHKNNYKLYIKLMRKILAESKFKTKSEAARYIYKEFEELSYKSDVPPIPVYETVYRWVREES